MFTTKRRWILPGTNKPIFALLLHDNMMQHGILMVAFFVLSGLLNYSYQFSMGKLLTPEQYGTVASLTSLLIVVGVIPQTVTTSTARYTSILNTADSGNLHRLRNYYFKRLSIVASIFTLIILGASPLISGFLNIDNNFLPFICLSAIPITLILSFNSGMLQGLQRFLPFGLIQAVVGFIKVLFGSLLVILGFGVYGSLVAIPLASIIALIISFFFLRVIPRGINNDVKTTDVGSYTFLTLLAILSITILTNIDVILSKHYLSLTEAGNYAIVSILGRIAYYSSAGIATAMFPKTSSIYRRRGNHFKIYLKALALCIIISGTIVTLYAIWPKQLSEFLFAGKYTMIVPFLFKHSLAMGLIALTFINMNYMLSIGQTKIAIPILTTTIIECILLILYHSNIEQILNIVLICSLLSLLSTFPIFLVTLKKADSYPKEVSA